jgi:putative CocE/NonD family hydrolase
VAIYNMGGWLDCYVTATFSFQDTLANKSKTLVGNYDHTQGFDGFGIECVRFFDRYLKGIENGVDEEPAFYVYTTGSEEWNFYDEWPLAEEKVTPYYLDAEGILSDAVPETASTDSYAVDYTTTSGEDTRWLAMTGQPSEYLDRAEEDEKCLTYTTPPLEGDLEVTGHPVLHLYVSSNAEDGDFFVYLEDVDENGFAQYKSEGQLRASLRSLSARPWLPELPYHRCFQADTQPLVPGEMVELVVDLFPVSHVFMRGHSIRVSLAGADVDNFRTPELSPAPTWTIYAGGENASYIDLPVIPGG